MKSHNKISTRISQIISVSILLAAVVAIGITACNNVNSPNGAKGSLQVKLTDSPARFDSVMIDIQKVEVQNVDSANGWMAISDSSMMVNLLDLTNGATTVLGEKKLDPGTYPQIRLVLGPDNYVIKNGQRSDLKVPSGQQSGLKINVNAKIEPNVTYSLLLDFDSNRSISGTVQPIEAKPFVYGISDSDTLATAIPDSTSGEFKLIGLSDGTYSLSIVPSDTSAYRDTTITNIDVSPGQTKQLGTIVLSNK